MDEATLHKQAATISRSMPMLMRQLFTIERDPVDDLPLAQLRVCSILIGGRQSMSVLSRDLRVSLSAMTQIADRLQRAGLVERVAEGADRRVRSLQLTERGRRIFQEREAARVRRVLAVIEQLPHQARRDVVAALETLLEACATVQRQEAGNVPADPASSPTVSETLT